MRHVVAYKKLKTMEIINHQPPKMVAIAYRNWSFTRGSNCKVLNGKNWGVLDRWSHMEDGLYYSDKKRLVYCIVELNCFIEHQQLLTS